MKQATDEGFLGDIRMSILHPATFEKEHPGWVLMAGQKVELNWELGTLGVTQLPDARGNFLRGMNMGRDGDTGDPDGDVRSVGSFQQDDFKRHNHRIPIYLQHGNWSSDGNNWATQTNYAPETCAIFNEGGNETRPKNICVYVYIKVY
ncbi:hypothetical protein WBG78_30540 [Chryseolinea sp. T2]|uniref:hypothetical protein n=1 Tax=Chryseolinea sp. T2 TaxID=3129255 RepID=UPI003076D14C